MTPQGHSISALAVELGRDRRTIAQACANLTPVGRQGKAELYRMSDVVVALTPAGTQSGTIDEARIRKITADAALAELQLERERGEVVRIEDVAKAIGDEYAAVRAKLLSIPTKLAPRIALEDGEAACRDLLAREITEALNELIGGGFEEGSPGEPEAAADPDGERMGGPVPAPIA
jgi:hypothetical protein